MNRREFLTTTAVVPALSGQTARPAPPADASGPSDRAAWVAAMRRIADPVLRNLAAGTLKARMPVEQAAGADRRNVTHLEAIGRLLAGLAPWIELPADATAEGRVRAEYADLARRAIARAVDPSSPDFLNFTRERQPLVDAAFLAQGLLRAKTIAARRARPRGEDAADRRASRRRGSIAPPFNNWLLFAATVEAALASLGAPWDRMRVDYALRQHDQWYKGDGLYGDGPLFHFDYYNSFVIHPMLVDVLAVCRDEMPAWKELDARVRERAARYAAIQERLISPEGTFPPIGRSIAYRFGAFHLLAQTALRQALPEGVSPAQVRGALTSVIGRCLDAPGTFDADGWLTIGFCGHQPGGRGDLHLDRQPVPVRGRPAAAGPAAGRRVLVSAAAAVDVAARLERAGVSHRSCDRVTVEGFYGFGGFDRFDRCGFGGFYGFAGSLRNAERRAPSAERRAPSARAMPSGRSPSDRDQHTSHRLPSQRRERLTIEPQLTLVLLLQLRWIAVGLEVEDGEAVAVLVDDVHGALEDARRPAASTAPGTPAGRSRRPAPPALRRTGDPAARRSPLRPRLRLRRRRRRVRAPACARCSSLRPASASSATVAIVAWTSDPKRGPNGRPRQRGKSLTSIRTCAATAAAPPARAPSRCGRRCWRCGRGRRRCGLIGLPGAVFAHPPLDSRLIAILGDQIVAPQPADLRRLEHQRVRIPPHDVILVGTRDPGLGVGVQRSGIAESSSVAGDRRSGRSALAASRLERQQRRWRTRGPAPFAAAGDDEAGRSACSDPEPTPSSIPDP